MNRFPKWVLVFIGFLWICTCSDLSAQDPVFSQFFSQKLYLNPAYSGYEPGTTISSLNRRQWQNLASNPLTPYSATFITNHLEISQDLPGFHSGFGIALTDNAEGEGQYALTRPSEGLLRWQRATFSYAFHSWDCDFYENADDEIWGFAIGGYASFNRFALDWQNLVFGDQLDPIYGVVRNSAITPPVSGMSDIEDWDFGLGTIFHFNISDYQLLTIGAAIHHLDLPNNSVAGNEERLPMRLSFHASEILEIGRSGSKRSDSRWQVIPNLRFELQRSSAAWGRGLTRAEKGIFHQDMMAGVMAKTPAAGSARISTGLWYNGNLRPTGVNGARFRAPEHSLVAYLGLDVATESRGNTTSIWEVGFSWDRNLGGIQSVGDVFELSISMGFPTLTLPGAGCSSCRKNQIRSRF